ncbi:MAG: metal ABC transporter substrate-binding protein [Chloroflexota bacterium]|nr:metal ABC transporter substrate-binding protein [Chloroflexota bacterium]MDQ5865599.1 metal ABC transporter substrate-binding protein [Chloroflexota bacterium]
MLDHFRQARLLRALAVLSLIVLVACDTGTPGSSTPPANTAPASGLNVVATTTQIRSMTEAVLGEHGRVRSILTPGADAHEFEPKPGDVQAISESDLVLKNGLGVDDWIDKLIENAGGERPLVTVTEGVLLREGAEEEGEEGEEEGGEHGAFDPHVWLNVSNAITMTANIRDALIEADPANEAAYKANADTYTATLRDLDRYIKDQIATIPVEDRKMVTNHDAFGYYIEAYGLTFVGSLIPSMSTGAQPSAQDVAELIRKIKSEKVKAIFIESSINPSLAQQIGGDAGVKVVDTLYGDSLGTEGTPGATYEGMMRYNTDTIVAALK